MEGSKATAHHRIDGGDRDGDDVVDGGMEHPASAVSCSICLDVVSDNCGRSRAKLHCGHEFHLDCIGSAFNMKGAMQCPNCWKVEKGQWLYGNGSTCSLPELSMDDWIPDEDFRDFSFLEMPFRVHWCPFGELTRVGPSFEELEPSTTYHDLRGHHGVFTEQASLGHSYVTYVGPVPPATTRSNNNVDDPHLNHHWNGLPGHNEIFNPHAFPAINIQYHNWGRNLPPFSLPSSHINSADPASVPPAALRSSHNESDAVTMPRSFPHPFVFDHGSGPRAGNSFVSSVVPPPHRGSSARTHERIQVSHAFHQQPSGHSPGVTGPIVPGVRRFEGPRSLLPGPPQHDQIVGFYIFPPASSAQNLHEAENSLSSQFHVWEREWLSRFPPRTRDSSWGSFHQTSGSSDSGNRSSSFWQNRHSP